MQEYDLSHKTNLRVSSPKLDVNFCDDGTSFLTVEPKLEKVLDPPLTTLPHIALYLATLGTTLHFSRPFPNPPLPLAQSMEFEVGWTLC